MATANMQLGQIIEPACHNIMISTSKLWNSLNHNNCKLEGQGDTIVYWRSGVAPLRDVRKPGAAAAGVPGGNPDSFYNKQMDLFEEQGINKGMYQEDPTAIGPQEHFQKQNFITDATYVESRMFRKTLIKSQDWSVVFTDEQLKFSPLKNLITQFTMDETAKIITPQFDRWATEKISAYVPEENVFEFNWTSGDLFKTFAAMNDKIKNAEFTDVSGLTLPHEGATRKLCFVTSTFFQRLALDITVGGAANLNLAGGGIATESSYKNVVNGFVGQLLGWELVEVHRSYMPFVKDDQGQIIVDAKGAPVRAIALAFDPDKIIAPLFVNDTVTIDGRTVGVWGTVLAGRLIYDCFVDVDDEWVAAGNKDNNQLFAKIIATDGSGNPINPDINYSATTR